MPETRCIVDSRTGAGCPLQVYFESRINSVEEKLADRLASSKEAVELARQQVEGRLQELNHFRTQMREDRSDFITREAYEGAHRNLEQRLDATRDRIITLEKVAANYEGRMWMLVAIMGFLFTCLQVAMKLFFK